MFINIFRWTFMIIVAAIGLAACLLAFVGNVLWEWLILIAEFAAKPFVMIYIWAIGFWSFITSVYVNLFDKSNFEQK